MIRLLNLAEAYRIAEAEREAALEEIESARAALRAAEARYWEALPTATDAREELLDCAASVDTHPKDGDVKQAEAGDAEKR